MGDDESDGAETRSAVGDRSTNAAPMAEEWSSSHLFHIDDDDDIDNDNEQPPTYEHTHLQS